MLRNYDITASTYKAKVYPTLEESGYSRFPGFPQKTLEPREAGWSNNEYPIPSNSSSEFIIIFPTKWPQNGGRSPNVGRLQLINFHRTHGFVWKWGAKKMVVNHHFPTHGGAVLGMLQFHKNPNISEYQIVAECCWYISLRPFISPMIVGYSPSFVG